MAVGDLMITYVRKAARMSDEFTSYEDEFTPYQQGISHFIEYLARDKEQSVYTIALTFQSRLERNIVEARNFGREPAQTAEMNKIISALNSLCLSNGGKSFNEWCRIGNASPYRLPAQSSFAVSPDMQIYVKALSDSLQNTLDIFEQEDDIYPFECQDRCKILQQDNTHISPEMIAQIIPSDTSQAFLIVALHHIKHSTEEIIDLINEFEPICQKSWGRKKRRHIHQNLKNVVDYIQGAFSSFLTD